MYSISANNLNERTKTTVFHSWWDPKYQAAQKNEASLTKPMIEGVDNHYILIIPVDEPVEIYQLCKTEAINLIKNISSCQSEKDVVMK